MANNPTSDIPIIIGSTKTILVELYKNLRNIQKVPGDDPSLAKAVVLDAQTSESGRAIMDAPNRLNATSEDTQKTIEKVRSDFRENIAAKFENLKGQIKEVNIERDQLKNEYTKLLDEQDQTINPLFKENKSPEEISHALSNLRTKQQQFSESVKKHLNSYRNLVRDLDQVHTDAYNNVNATEKKGLPLPEQEKVAIARQKI